MTLREEFNEWAKDKGLDPTSDWMYFIWSEGYALGHVEKEFQKYSLKEDMKKTDEQSEGERLSSGARLPHSGGTPAHDPTTNEER